jgi:hypothetical protein
VHDETFRSATIGQDVAITINNMFGNRSMKIFPLLSTRGLQSISLFYFGKKYYVKLILHTNSKVDIIKYDCILKQLEFHK